MSVTAWLRKVFGGAAVSPADSRKLSTKNEAALAQSTRNLPHGERGWISLPESADLFLMKIRCMRLAKWMTKASVG